MTTDRIQNIRYGAFTGRLIENSLVFRQERRPAAEAGNPEIRR